MTSNTVKVLAIASAGGHWVQLFRMRQSWRGCKVDYISTKAGYRDGVMADAAARGEATPGFYVVPEANRWQKVRLLLSLLKIAAIMARCRPHIVISTGAAPGYFALRIARLMGARTVWIDSIANAEELSLSGRLASKYSDVCLTQWEDLATEGRLQYWGAVL